MVLKEPPNQGKRAIALLKALELRSRWAVQREWAIASELKNNVIARLKVSELRSRWAVWKGKAIA
jgi:hypothetical protein